MDAKAWDERYRAADRLWSATPNVFVANRFAEVEPGVGLDLASGEGRNAIWLAERGWEMVAVDFSSVALDRGRALSDRVEFVEADVFTWEPGRSFDLILIAYLQVEAEPLSELVKRARGWLNPGGELFMVGHDISNLDEGVGGPQSPDLLWDLDLMLEWLGELRLIEGGVHLRPVEVDGDIAHARDTLIRARRV
ncbi:MAG TPA: class I SAM-dependent methyltransferase [Acidimicrobiia bacterium]|nr:class I SAM-dependent methyltransferase [Acidimicrobiia bacterium]